MVLRRGLVGASLATAGLLGTPSRADAQAPGGCSLSGGLTVSDRVGGAFSLGDAPDGSPRLAAVILARGRPGWASESPPSGRYEGPPPLPGGRVRLLSGSSAGALLLVYEVDTGLAWVGSRPVRLGTDNVVLVDGADSVPTIVRTMHITPPIAPGRAACAIERAEAIADSLKAALAREPSLRAFLMP